MHLPKNRRGFFPGLLSAGRPVWCRVVRRFHKRSQRVAARLRAILVLPKLNRLRLQHIGALPQSRVPGENRVAPLG